MTQSKEAQIKTSTFEQKKIKFQYKKTMNKIRPL